MERVIIESEAGYEAGRKHFHPGNEIFWYTTSPYLIDALGRKKENVCSLEKGLDKGLSAGMGILCSDLANQLCEWLNVRCDSWRSDCDLRIIFAGSCQLCLTPLVHKALLLSKLMNHQPGHRDQASLTIVGDPAAPVTGINMNFGRFDNLYAYLGKAVNHPRIQLLEYAIPAVDLQRIQRAIRHRRISVLEKTLGIINCTPSAFLFKSWKNLKQLAGSRTRRIGMNCGQTGNAVIHKECELIDEAFVRLLAKGWRVGFLGDLPAIEERKEEDVGFLEEEIVQKVLELFEKLSVGRTHRPDLFIESALKLFARRAFDVLRKLKANFQKLIYELEKTAQGLEPRSMVFTNAMTTPLEKVLYLVLKKKGIPVVSFEHGITEGLAQFNHFQPEIMEAADIKVYHTRLSREYNSNRSGINRTYIVGLPTQTRRVRFKRLQRALLRKRFSVSPKETVVIYPTEVEINNSIYGPYIENDWEFYSKTRDLIYEVLGKIPFRVCLKVYPENRYVDRGLFASDEWLPRNCFMVKEFDFRFIRGLGDIIVSSSTYSTLGWVWGTGVPIIYLEYPFQPLAHEVREFFKSAVYYFDCSSPVWKKDMVSLLNLPFNDVMDGWNERARYRQAHEEYFVTGPERQDFISSLSASAKSIWPSSTVK